MNTLVVTHYFAAHGGGIEQAAEKLLQELVVLGHRFTWAASDCDQLPVVSGVDCVPMRSWNGLEKRTGLPLPLWSFSALTRLVRMVKAHDVIWLHDTLYIGNIVAALAAKLYRKKLVVTQHVGAIPYKNIFLHWAQRLAMQLISKPILRLSDAIVFVSDYVARQFAGINKNSQTIPLGVDQVFFKPVSEVTRSALRTTCGVKDDHPILLFVGRFVERKGLYVLQMLVKLFPDALWQFCGAGPIDVRSWQQSNLRVLGYLPAAQLAEVYQAADLLVLPSVGEGFPLTIQQALACGLPVLCAPETAAGSTAAEALLFTCRVDIRKPKETTTRWANVLQGLCADLKTLRRKGQEGAHCAAVHWQWAETARRYDALFRTMT